MTEAPNFPPLMKGLAASPANPFTIAVAQAERGVDAGLIAWSITAERLRAALVLAPETPLEPAMAGMIACGVGLQNALGVMVPPETAVHLEWQGGLRLNGGHCGGLHVAISPTAPGSIPDWMVVGLDLTLSLPPEYEPGETPDWTALDQEGCAELDAVHLLEGWARHTLLWMNELDDAAGRAKLFREWQGLAWQIGQEISLPLDGSHVHGTFLGADENFGMLLKQPDGTTRLIPLSTILEDC